MGARSAASPRVRTTLGTLLSTKLGRCPKCFRASLKGAIIGWLAFASVHVALPGSPLQWFVCLCAVMFSLLWASHMMTFATRSAGSTRTAVTDGVLAHVNRGQALRTFGIALLFAVLASAAFPARARADTTCKTCGDSDCPDTPADCGDDVCCTKGSVYCAKAYKTAECSYYNQSCFKLSGWSVEQLKKFSNCCPVQHQCT